DGQRVLVAQSQRSKRVLQARLSREEQVRGVAELERQGRVPDVARGEADMDEAGVGPELLLEAREKRDHLVLDALLDGEDPRDVHARRPADPRHRVGRNATAAGVRVAHGELHPEPRPVLGLLAPEASHLGAGVTLDHALTLEQKSPERKSLRSRRADCRNDRAARSIETKDGGVGGPMPGPTTGAVEPQARPGRGTGGWGPGRG